MIILCMGSALSASWAQTTELFIAKIKREAVPAAILEAITEDFPDAEITEYATVPLTVVEDVVYVNANREAENQDYDTYLITMNGKDGHFQVTYDKTGKLLTTVEVLKDVALPRPVMVSIGRHFPKWAVVGDKEVMTSVKDGHQKTHYKVTLEQGKEKHHVIFDADGNIVKGADKAKPHRQIKFAEDREMKKWHDGGRASEN
jgi:hypothetical protein